MVSNNWHARTKVLCLFRYWGFEKGESIAFDDAIMIEVDFKDQVAAAFDEAIGRARRRGWAVGPAPTRWMLTGYLPEKPLARAAASLH